MTETSQFEDVLQIRMSRVINSVPAYWVCTYLVDGLLIDTGCSYTAQELAACLADRKIDTVMNSPD